MDFTGEDGWPCEFEESPWGVALITAIRALPGGDALDGDTVTAQARMIWAVAEGGRDEELPRNRSASQEASEAEIAKLVELSERLADHIEAMRRPALSALTNVHAYPFEAVRSLRAMAEQAKVAYSEINVSSAPRGRRQKIEAAEVAFIAARLFEEVTDCRATFTSHESGNVSGEWPDFLSAVYDALGIKASVPAQVRALNKKGAQIQH
ncbi:hypothetical protein [Oceaniradius stylonematis]|uniref:hypothetical protein n=1 Tax=Oceaniradius stylonematis TaxID=2184161 RepID=UPI003C7BD3A8